MARLTVEDCVLKVPNRFELVMLASQRARNLAAGATTTLERENDKNPVIALREIADGVVELDQLRDSLVHGMQKQVEVDEPEEEGALTLPLEEMMASGSEGAGESETEEASADNPEGAPREGEGGSG